MHELHVDQLGAGIISERMAVARVFPRITGDLPRLADAARREHDGARLEQHEAAGLAEVSQRAGDLPADHKQADDRALHVHVDPGVHALVLEDADHLEAGAVADVGQAAVGVAAEGPLVDATIGRAIEQRAPRLELVDPIGGFLGVDLGHAPVVVHLAAAHRVAEMHAPGVFSHHVAERRGGAPLGHDGVGFAEQRLADERDLGLVRARLYGGPEAGATGADHDDVVVQTTDISHEVVARVSRIRALKRRLGNDTRPEGRSALRPSGRAKSPSRPFRARIKTAPSIIRRAACRE